MSTATQQQKREERADWESDQASGHVEFFERRTRVDSLRALLTRAGFRRHKDFDETNGTGQDFAAIQSDERYAVGLVVDGVSQSFFGDIAARELGAPLFQFLWTNRSNPPGFSELESRLKRISEQVSEVVQNYKIPDHVNGILKTVLEESRQEGSQAVFSAFIWDALAQQATVYKVGDCFASFVDNYGRTTIQESDPSGRFSSKGDTALQLVCETYSDICAAFVASDGLTRDQSLSARPEQLAEDLFKEKAEELSRYDDVSFAYVERQGPPPSGKPPAGPKVRNENAATDPRSPEEVGKSRRVLKFAIPGVALLTGMLLGAGIFPVFLRLVQAFAKPPVANKQPDPTAASRTPVAPLRARMNNLPRDQIIALLQDNPDDRQRIGAVFVEVDTLAYRQIAQIAFSYEAGVEKISLQKDLVKDVPNWVVLPELGAQQDVKLAMNGNLQPQSFTLKGYDGNMDAQSIPGFYSLTLSP